MAPKKEANFSGLTLTSCPPPPGSRTSCKGKDTGLALL